MVMVHIVENKEPEIDYFGVIFSGMEFAQMTNSFQI